MDICKRIKRCRICGSANLREVISLGDQYIASIFASGELPDHVNQRIPLEVVRCAEAEGCGLVQLRHSVEPDIMYDHYGYRSGTNEMMRANLRGIVSQIEDIVSLQARDLVLDIGCNDGTLLKAFSVDGLDLVGIDPSDAVKAIDRSDITVINDFFNFDVFDQSFPGRRAKAVTSIAMFYDLEEPATFVRDVARLLAEDGVWVIELSYLPAMLQTNAFDTICHEHLEYYSLRPIEWLLAAEGLRVDRAEINDVNGGSIRLFIRSTSLPPSSPANQEALAALRTEEEALALRTDRPYETFRSICYGIRDQLKGLLQKLTEEGATIYAYGASTKGNTLLQFCGIDHRLLAKAADRNPDKWGTRTIGTEIPIVSEEEARRDDPDYFLVLPWHFFQSFVAREREYLEGGGRFILPLPQVRIVDHASL